MKTYNLIAYLEGKFQKPEIYYHVTNAKNLRSILKQGLIANPKERTYAQGDQATYGGIYFSEDLKYAMNVGNPEDTDKLIIIAQLTKGSLVHDEDYIVSGLENIVVKFLKKYKFDMPAEFGAYLYWLEKNNIEKYKSIESEFIEEFNKKFLIKNEFNIEIIKSLFKYYFLLNSHYKGDIATGLQDVDDKNDLIYKELIHNLPSIREQAKKYIDLASKRIKNNSNWTVMASTSKRILIDSNISYSGNNKIIEVAEYQHFPKKIIIHYDPQNLKLKYINLLKKPILKIENGKQTYIQ